MNTDTIWLLSLSQEEVDKIFEKVDQVADSTENRSHNTLAFVDYPLDRAINELYSEKHLTFESLEWLKEIGYPIIDHPLVVSENLILLYPYHIKNDQLKELMTEAESHGYKIDIDGFAHKKQYHVRIVVYRLIR